MKVSLKYTLICVLSVYVLSRLELESMTMQNLTFSSSTADTSFEFFSPHQLKDPKIQSIKSIWLAKRHDESKTLIHTSIDATTNQECILQTTPFHRHQRARLVVFQRDGRRQLRRFISHYSRVLEPDAIVIIDHLGQDSMTHSMLQEYASLGVHVWKCTRPFYRKAQMWTDITRVYANDSDYIFPLDVDELIAVKQNSKNGLRKEQLVWNQQVFYDSLNKLEQQTNDDEGKPFKMEILNVVPPECHDNEGTQDMLQRQNLTNEPYEMEFTTTTTSSSLGYTSDMCHIRYVKAYHQSAIDSYCRRKVFTKGSDFYQTDIGNHYGGTNKYPALDYYQCIDNPSIYNNSTLGIIHLQQLTFEEWLIHGLRGASDRGFTKTKSSSTSDSNNIIDCTNVKFSHHYCLKWQTFQKAQFSPYQLREKYQNVECPKMDNDTMMSIIPIQQDVFCASSR